MLGMRDNPVAPRIDSVDLTRIEATPEDILRVQRCEIANDPDRTYLRARRLAYRIRDPEKLVRRFRAALSVESDASALAFLYALCNLFDESPEVLVRRFGGSHLLEDLVDEGTLFVNVLKSRSRRFGPKERLRAKSKIQECILMATALARALKGRKEEKIAHELFDRLTDLLA